jgi:hypothetical protein
MRQSLPDDDDSPAEINPRGRKHFGVLEDDENERTPVAMPSWSWTDLLVLMCIGVALYFLIYKSIAKVIGILFSAS